MSRELRLRLTFEGKGAGLERGRLTIDAFAPALISLQRAFRRIAQGLVNVATDGTSDFTAASRGRFSTIVADLAWEIDAISHHSPPAVELVCPIPDVSVGTTWPMFLEETVDRAADELLFAIEAEAKGTRRNAAAREYLAILPQGLVRQSCALQKLDGSHREIILGAFARDELERDYPYFALQTAQIAGVSFSPLPPEVRFYGEGSVPHAFADERQVEQALGYRSQTVTGLLVRKGKRTTSLWLEPGRAIPAAPSRPMRDRHFAARWAPALRLLAE